MEKPNFDNKNLIEFLKSEFNSRNRRNGILGTVASFFQLFVFGLFNYQKRISWNETYRLIEKKLLEFYPELNCELYGNRPTIIELLKNHGTERIEFNFDKAHLAVTSDSFYVFPYDSAEFKDQGTYYNMLEEPFRIIYNPNQKKDKYSIISTVSEFISIKTEYGKTKIEFKTAELNTETELIFDREITIANTVYN